MADKNPNSIIDNLKNDFATRVGRNPTYMQMAKYARGDDEDKADEYFYAFKDAYEQSKDFNKYGLMMQNDLDWRLSDRYYKLLDDDYEARGLNPNSDRGIMEYEKYYQPEFESKYGTHDDFVKKSMNAWKKWMAENYGGHSEDHQSFGKYIRDNPDKFQKLEQLTKYYNDWAGPGSGTYKDLLSWWTNKLGFGGK